LPKGLLGADVRREQKRADAHEKQQRREERTPGRRPVLKQAMHPVEAINASGG
jgi:hypothetical protein